MEPLPWVLRKHMSFGLTETDVLMTKLRSKKEISMQRILHKNTSKQDSTKTKMLDHKSFSILFVAVLLKGAAAHNDE
jgi:hypothetical protein